MTQRQQNISNEEIKKAAYASSRIEGYPNKMSPSVKHKAARILKTLLESK